MNETSGDTVNKPNKVTQKLPNPLIDARYKLPVDEQKILFTLLSKINEANSEHDGFIIITQKEITDTCHFDAKSGAAIILNGIKGLRRRNLDLEDEQGKTIITGWITAAEFTADKETVIIEYDMRLKEKMLNLRENYTTAPTGLLMSFRRDYSPKFYAWLKQFPLGKRCTYSLEFFIVHFDLPESYKSNFTHFRRKFFEPCIKEINEISDIGVVYDYVKEGRAYTKINMAVAAQHKAKMTRLSDKGQIGEGWTNREKALLIVMTNPDKWGMEKERAEELLLGYDADRIKRNMNFANRNRREKVNLTAWLEECIENDAAINGLAAEIVAEAETQPAHLSAVAESTAAEMKKQTNEEISAMPQKEEMPPTESENKEIIAQTTSETEEKTTDKGVWQSDWQKLKSRLNKAKRRGNLPGRR